MKLSDIRARDNCGAVDWDWAVADRRELLRRLDVLASAARSADDCLRTIDVDPYDFSAVATALSGLDAALKEIEGENNG